MGVFSAKCVLLGLWMICVVFLPGGNRYGRFGGTCSYRVINELGIALAGLIIMLFPITLFPIYWLIHHAADLPTGPPDLLTLICFALMLGTAVSHFVAWIAEDRNNTIILVCGLVYMMCTISVGAFLFADAWLSGISHSYLYAPVIMAVFFGSMLNLIN